jgi:branched-chain amino acid transport system substrate-binding protein
MRDHGFKTFAVVPALALAGALIFGSAASAQNLVRVGAPLPLTGPLSPEGVKQKQGYDLWAETANAKGGITVGGKTYKVEIVYVDYASNTPRAVQAAERLITDDKVNFLFSPFGSGAAKAASNVSEKYGIPTIAATASSAQVRPGLQVSVRDIHAQRHPDRAARRYRRQA